MRIFTPKVCLLAMPLLLLSLLTFAQGTDASISGKVTESGSDEPLPGATILVENQSTGFSIGTSTDLKGRFILKELPLGGPYEITINYVGYQPVSLTGYQLNLGDQIMIDEVSLVEGETVLKEILVDGNNFMNRRDRLGSSTAITGRDLQKLPTQSRNYMELAALSPHTRGGAIGGNKPGTQGYLLDGVTNRRTVFGEPAGGAFPISLETIREFEIVTNAYDVTNGRGAGGVVKAVTKSGTNDFHGAVWGYYSGDFLSGSRDINGNNISSDFTTGQFGASLSGPLVKDKLHFFTSYDEYRNTFPYRAYDFNYEGATLEEAEKNLGITQSNLDQVVSVLEDQYGIPQVQQYGEIQIVRVTKNFFTRLDWKLNPYNTITLRYNFQSYDDPAKKKGNGLLSTQYRGFERDHSLLLALKTQFSERVYNDFKFSFMDNERLNQLIYPRAPEGFVEIESSFADGTSNMKTVEFGNQNWVPEIIASSSYQLVNNTTYRTGNVLFTFGTDNIFTQIKDQLTHRQQGEFHYRSLEDLQNNTPWRFTRKIPIGGAGGRVFPQILELGLYAQAEAELLSNLHMTAGLRWDATLLPEAPNYNALLEQELGIRNDVTPFDADNIQPRLNLTWDVSGDGKNVVKAGAGWFASQFTTQAFTMSHIDNGINFKEIDVREESLPIPDWPAYYEDFSKVPGEEYLNSLDLDTPPAFVIALDENLETPMTLRTNISYHRYFTDWFRAGIGVYYNNTKDNFYYVNRNLVTAPSFTLGNEGGREIYAPAETLEGQDRADYNNARRSDLFTEVLQYTNTDWNNTYLAFTFEGAVKIRDGSLNFSYTRGQSKGGPTYNSGNAQDNFAVARSYWNYGAQAANWYDGEDMRHKVVISGVSPTFYGFNISTNLILYQWDRFSAGVNRDINGDGNTTDVAFVFDPNHATTPENIRQDMQTLLASTSPEYRQYLEDYMGSFAAWNGGLMPWRHTWNLSVSKEINTFQEQQLILRADVFNVLNLFNYQWGGYQEIINTNLYNVDGFNAQTNAYDYSVNQNAGTKRKNGLPFNVQLGIKYVF
ncbi:MAG: carboxypeptidase regulatory-like domain-containing protein [Cyclobacteriaceae bacterium]